MNKSLGLRLQSKVFSLATLFCILVGFALLMWFSVTNWFQYNRLIGEASFSQMCGDYVNEVITAHARSGFNLFAPIFAVIPSVTIFCDDYNSGYIKSILSRTSKQRYIRECVLCCSIAGGIAVMIPDLLCSMVFIIAAEPHQQTGISSYYDLLSGIEYIWEGRLLIAVFLMFSFLFGVVWANIGLCISAYCANRYVAMAAPFAVYYGLHLVLQRTKIFAVLSPVNMIQPTLPALSTLFFPVCYQFVLLGVAIFLFYRRANRRLHNV